MLDSCHMVPLVVWEVALLDRSLGPASVMAQNLHPDHPVLVISTAERKAVRVSMVCSGPAEPDTKTIWRPGDSTTHFLKQCQYPIKGTEQRLSLMGTPCVSWKCVPTIF